MPFAPGEYITRFLTDEAGSPEMAIDGVATPTLYEMRVVSGFTFGVRRIHFTIIDNFAVNSDRFGGIVGPKGVLDNGVQFFLANKDGTKVIDLLEGLTIKRNADLFRYCGNCQQIGGDRAIGAEWFLPFDLPAGWRIVAFIEDDLSSLLSFTIAAQGIVADGQVIPQQSLRLF